MYDLAKMSEVVWISHLVKVQWDQVGRFSTEGTSFSKLTFCFYCTCTLLWSQAKQVDSLPVWRVLWMYSVSRGWSSCVTRGGRRESVALSDRKLRLDERTGHPEFKNSRHTRQVIKGLYTTLWKSYSLTLMFTWWLRLKESVNSTQTCWSSMKLTAGLAA